MVRSTPRGICARIAACSVRARGARQVSWANGFASDEPLPTSIQDAVAAAIEDGATMDEIVSRVRSRDGDRSPLIPRARRCARARPAEGRWAERMEGLICLQRETVRFAEEWERTRDPRAEGLSALSRSRPCERWRSARWPSSARTRSRCGATIKMRLARIG